MFEAPDLLSTKHVTVPIAGTGPNKLDIIPSWFTTDGYLKSCAFYVHCALLFADWKVCILPLVFRQRNLNIEKEEHPFCKLPDYIQPARSKADSIFLKSTNAKYRLDNNNNKTHICGLKAKHSLSAVQRMYHSWLQKDKQEEKGHCN